MGNSGGTKVPNKKVEIPEGLPAARLNELLINAGVSHEVVQSFMTNWSMFGSESPITKLQFRLQAQRFMRNVGLLLDCDYFVDRIFMIMDTNGDGSVSRGEFFASFHELLCGDEKYFLDLTFRIYAVSRPPELTYDDLYLVVQSLWTQGLREILIEQQDDLFDIDEQLRELLITAESQYKAATDYLFASISSIADSTTTGGSRTSRLELPSLTARATRSPSAGSLSDKIINPSAFELWARTDPKLTVTVNETSKVKHFIVKRRS